MDAAKGATRLVLSLETLRDGNVVARASGLFVCGERGTRVEGCNQDEGLYHLAVSVQHMILGTALALWLV
jgi:hypothetical protein